MLRYTVDWDKAGCRAKLWSSAQRSYPHRMFGHFVVVVLGKVKEIISFIQLLLFWDILRVLKSLTTTTKAKNTLHYRGSTWNQPCFISIPSSPFGLSSKISLARLLGSQYPFAWIPTVQEWNVLSLSQMVNIKHVLYATRGRQQDIILEMTFYNFKVSFFFLFFVDWFITVCVYTHGTAWLLEARDN